MAKKKQEDPPKGAPAWMNTFSDLMNLLLCFFVLLFSMSTVDTDKLEAVVASLQNAISILPTGGTSIGEGEMISAGVRQLEFLDSYYNEMANSKAENTDEQTDGKLSAQEQYEQQQLAESEKMADEIQQELDNSQLSGKVDVDFNAEYVKLNLNGSILFASGKADLVKQAVPIVNKLGKILEKYNRNVIEIEGHAEADREDIDLEVHHARVAFAHGDLIVNLFGMGIADAHHAHVHFDGHVVGGEGYDARRNAQREGVAGFVGSLHGRVVGEARLRASGRERHLVEQREAFVASQRDVLPPDRRRRIGLLERVEIPGHDVRARLLVAEMQFGVVQLEQRARIDEASSEA